MSKKRPGQRRGKISQRRARAKPGGPNPLMILIPLALLLVVGFFAVRPDKSELDHDVDRMAREIAARYPTEPDAHARATKVAQWYVDYGVELAERVKASGPTEGWLDRYKAQMTGLGVRYLDLDPGARPAVEEWVVKHVAKG